MLWKMITGTTRILTRGLEFNNTLFREMMSAQVDVSQEKGRDVFVAGPRRCAELCAVLTERNYSNECVNVRNGYSNNLGLITYLAILNVEIASGWQNFKNSSEKNHV